MTPLRIDDVGASSKRYEFHWGKWVPYREMDVWEIHWLLDFLRDRQWTATIAVTATWIEWDGQAVPFDSKFPEELKAWRGGVDDGTIEIACHGLTHCIPGQHRPRWFRSNRKWHREFIDAVPADMQLRWLRSAKQLLEIMFATGVTTLVPPGNTISYEMERAAFELGFDRITYRVPDHMPPHPRRIDDRHYTVLHDRDLVQSWRHRRCVQAFEHPHGPYRSVREWDEQP